MTITIGTPVIGPGLTAFSELDKPPHQCIEIGTDLFIYLYKNDGTGDLEARIVNPSSLTVGAIGGAIAIRPYTFNMKFAHLNDSHFMLLHKTTTSSPNRSQLNVQVGNVTSGSVVMGSSTQIAEFDGFSIFNFGWNITSVGDGTGLVVFSDVNIPALRAVAFTVSGVVVGVIGPTVSINTTAGAVYDNVTISPLRDNQHVIAGYMPSAIGSWVQVLSVSGTTVSFGTPVQIGTSQLVDNTRIIGMSPTRAAVFQNTFPTHPNLTGSGVQLDISGLTVAAAGLAAFFGGAGDYSTLITAIRLSDDVGMIHFVNQNGVSESLVEFTVNSTLGMTLDDFELVAPSAYDNVGVCHIGDNRAGVVYDTDQVAIVATDLIIPPVAAETGFFILSVMPSREGIHVWCTTWENDFLQLRRLNTTTMFYDRIYFLGPATFTEVSTRVRLAFVFAISDDRVLVYGSMSAPGGLAGDQHIIELDEAIDNEFNSIVSTWGSDLAAAVHVGHPNGTTRKYFAIREAALNPPQLQWNEGASPIFDTISVLPFDAGDVLTHRAMDYNLTFDQLVIVGRFRGVAPIAVIGNGPYSSWTDITEDFPLGADIKAARYLTGNG